MRPARLSVLAVLFVACGSPPAAAPPPPSPPAEIVAAAPVPAAAPSATPTVPTAAAAGADAGAPPPAPVPRTGKIWPFHAWTRAEAVTFNKFAQRPYVPLVAYGDKGWSPHVAERKPITLALAKKAFEIADTTGDLDVSKCPFPRHAVVFFDGDLPVASANVCFECGDIVLWPHYWDSMPTDAPKKERDAAMKKRKGAYAIQEITLSRWREFFSRDLQITTEERYDP